MRKRISSHPADEAVVAISRRDSEPAFLPRPFALRSVAIFVGVAALPMTMLVSTPAAASNPREALSSLARSSAQVIRIRTWGAARWAAIDLRAEVDEKDKGRPPETRDRTRTSARRWIKVWGVPVGFVRAVSKERKGERTVQITHRSVLGRVLGRDIQHHVPADPSGADMRSVEEGRRSWDSAGRESFGSLQHLRGDHLHRQFRRELPAVDNQIEHEATVGEHGDAEGQSEVKGGIRIVLSRWSNGDTARRRVADLVNRYPGVFSPATWRAVRNPKANVALDEHGRAGSRPAERAEP